MPLRVPASWVRLLPAVIFALCPATRARAQVYAPTIHTVSIDDGENLRPGSTLTLRFTASAGSLPLESLSFNFVNATGVQRVFTTRSPQDGVLTAPVTEEWLNGIYRLLSVTAVNGLMGATYADASSSSSTAQYAVPPGPSDTLLLTRFVVSGARAYVKPVLTAFSRTGAAEMTAGASDTLTASVTPGSAAVTRLLLAYDDPNGVQLDFESAGNPTQAQLATSAAWPSGRYTLQLIGITDATGQITNYFRNGRIDNPSGPPAHALNFTAGDFSLSGGFDGTFVFPEIGTFTLRTPQARVGGPVTVDYTLTPGARPLKTVQFTFNGPISIARLVSTATGASGTATLTVPAAMVSGRYTLDRIEVIDAGDYQATYQSNGIAVYLPARLKQARSHGLSFSAMSFTLDGGIAPIPVITVQPKDETVEPGRGVELRATVVTPVAATSQWYEGAAGDTRKPISSGTGARLAVAPLTETRYWLRATNAHGSADSRTATVAPRLASQMPVFLAQPASVVQSTGSTVTLNAAVSGPGPLTFQWFKDGLPIAGATGEQLRVAAAQTTASGTYHVVVANSQGSVRSDPVQVTLREPPRLLAQTPSLTVRAGERANLDVTATGGVLRYSWVKGTSSVRNSVGSTYSIATAQPGDSGVYDVRVSNDEGSVTASLRLDVVEQEPPAFDSPFLRDVYTVVGDATGIAVGASGFVARYDVSSPLPPGLDWYPGAPLLTGVITQAGNYPVTITATNRAGTASRTITFRVFAQLVAPIFVVQPQSQQTYADQRVTLTADLADTRDPFVSLRLQWKRNGVALSLFRQEKELILAPIRLGDAGTYTLEATNSRGTTVSQSAVITVLPAIPPPTITVQPQAQRVAPGATANFSVGATSPAPLSYQWFRNGSAIAGATTATLRLAGVESPQAGAYTAEVANPLGTTRSASAALTLDEVVPGHLANLSVRSLTASGERTLIAGFALSGGRPKPLLLRVVGPGLGLFGIREALPDPKLTLASGGRTLESNDDWISSTDYDSVSALARRLGAFSLNFSDSAIMRSLDAGAYSLLAGTAMPASGIALIELYDADETFGRTSARLVNVSARSQVGTGADVLIAGFVVVGQTPCRLLVRGIGPGLAAFGVGGALARPRLQVFSGSTALTENSGWTAQATENAAAAQSVGAFALNAASADAALVTSLSPGAYTVILSGLGGTTGIGLIEIYALP